MTVSFSFGLKGIIAHRLNFSSKVSIFIMELYGEEYDYRTNAAKMMRYNCSQSFE